jgi:oligoribonuclease
MTHTRRFVWLDIETTGLNPLDDRILSLGVIVTAGLFNELARGEWVVGVGVQSYLKNAAPFVQAMHAASGLDQRVAESKLSLREVIELANRTINGAWLGLEAHAFDQRPILAGSSIHFDRGFLAAHAPEFLDTMHYRMLDVSSFKVLGESRGITAPKHDKAHTPLADLEASQRELKFWLKALTGSESDPGEHEGHPVACRECSGKGRVFNHRIDRQRWATCHECNGTGLAK